jgi:hypothetical protein
MRSNCSTSGHVGMGVGGIRGLGLRCTIQHFAGRLWGKKCQKWPVGSGRRQHFIAIRRGVGRVPCGSWPLRQDSPSGATFGGRKRAASARVVSSTPGPPVGALTRVSARLKSALGFVALLIIRDVREFGCKWQSN